MSRDVRSEGGVDGPSAGGVGTQVPRPSPDAARDRSPRQDPQPGPPNPGRSLRALSGREILRVSKLWTQTILAPVVASFLFILVFGLSLGSRIREFGGFPYEVFIVPGLIAMAMAQAAFSNNSSSILQARNDRYINDVLAAPMHAWQMNLGLTIGGVFRALVIGAALMALAIPLTGVPVERPLALLAAVLMLVTLFAALGTVVGVYAKSFDHHSFVNNILILPLTFLGGVFYSIEILPPVWEALSHANPLFYIVNAVRYGFLGSSDVSVALSFAVTAAITGVFVAWSQWLFATGRKLKP
jgi:ABC-2 type transport system permease protein